MRAAQVFLLADLVGFREQLAEAPVNFFRVHQAKLVQTAPDPEEARLTHPAHQHKVPAQHFFFGGDGSKAHAHHEGDTRLAPDDGHRAVLAHGGYQSVECLAHHGVLALEMRGQRHPHAGVPLLAVGKPPPALRTPPQRSLPHGPPFIPIVMRLLPRTVSKVWLVSAAVFDRPPLLTYSFP